MPRRPQLRMVAPAVHRRFGVQAWPRSTLVRHIITLFQPSLSPDRSGVPQLQNTPAISEVLPKAGLVVSEKGSLSEILCKPKLMPLKSVTLQKLEEMEVSGGPHPSARGFPPLRAAALWPPRFLHRSL